MSVFFFLYATAISTLGNKPKTSQKNTTCFSRILSASCLVEIAHDQTRTLLTKTTAHKQLHYFLCPLGNTYPLVSGNNSSFEPKNPSRSMLSCHPSPLHPLLSSPCDHLNNVEPPFAKTFQQCVTTSKLLSSTLHCQKPTLNILITLLVRK